MIVESQNDLYFKRMASSLGDKIKIINHLKNGKVLDIGSGGGNFSDSMYQLGYDVTALDGSPKAIEQMQQNYPHLKTIQSSAHNTIDNFEPDYFDNIVCSSILHEIYSYNDSGLEGMEAMESIIDDFYYSLKPGGRLIIRDGVIPSNWEEPITIQFKNEHVIDGFKFLDYYADNSPFYSNSPGKLKVHFEQFHDNSIKGNYGSLMEFLYTYTWGFKSVQRESQELYGIMTESDYCAFLTKHNFTINHSEQYVQSGYIDNLSQKVIIKNLNGENIAYPSSNMIIVATKT